jgi:homogentisate 1,2-dioxygenase
MSRSRWIPLPRIEGRASRQAHADLPDGTYEREISKEGFFGPATQMYHRHAPTGWTRVSGPLRPRAFDTTRLQADSASPWQAPVVLRNTHVEVRVWCVSERMTRLARDADGDLLLFVHEGGGWLFCDYGHIALRDGDYMLLPRGTMWRLEPASRSCLLMIESVGASFQLPDRGIAGQHAVFDPAVLEQPSIDELFLAQQTDDPWQVEVKRNGALSAIEYPFNPLDAVGWHGTLVPLRLNWRDIRPLMSHRYHVAPSAHSTFTAPRFVVCTFCPRPIETDPGALKVPFFHNNDDYDEMIFYHRGEFFSRDNIHPGMVTLHPGGITHGPHPKAFETGAKAARKETDEVAVMIDTRDALEVCPALRGVELEDYAQSWKKST